MGGQRRPDEGEKRRREGGEQRRRDETTEEATGRGTAAATGRGDGRGDGKGNIRGDGRRRRKRAPTVALCSYPSAAMLSQDEDQPPLPRRRRATKTRDGDGDGDGAVLPGERSLWSGGEQRMREETFPEQPEMSDAPGVAAMGEGEWARGAQGSGEGVRRG